MKRLIVCLMLAAAPAVFAQEHKEGEAQHGEEARHEEPIWGLPRITWTTINFALLALGLGYMIGKSAPGFFRGRTEEIQGNIRESTVARQEAEARAAEIERKMAALGAEIERLRTESKTEMQAEAARTAEEAGRAIDKVQQHAEQEIVSAARHARRDLKAYSAQLALELAEQRIRREMSPHTQESLVNGFVDDLARQRVHRETQ